jgi:hypothetical protein
MRTLYVERGSATGEELQGTIDAIVADIATGQGELADEARAAGVRADVYTGITVSEDAQGFLPFAALLVVFAGSAGKELAGRFWEDVLLPEIRRRQGADAVGDRHEDGSDHSG